MNFMSEEHEHFYKDNIVRCKFVDSNQRALIYLLGLRSNCRKNIEEIFDFDNDSLKVEALGAEWASDTDKKIMRMGFNLFSGEMVSVTSLKAKGDMEAAVKEADNYSVSSIFSCVSLSDYLMEALRIRFEL